VTTPGLEEWIAAEARLAAVTMARAISATDLVMERPGFGQRIIPQPGSVLASPVIAHYDPDPDYFFHWFRDSALVIDALRVALARGYLDRSAVTRLRECVQFGLSLLTLEGDTFLRRRDFRAAVQPDYLQFLRSDEELRALKGRAVLADTRVNADGSLDFIRWSRPQTDGPALRALALLRWWHELAQLQDDPALRDALTELLDADLTFTRAHIHRPSSDVWEERVGHHYYTQLLQTEALSRGARWRAGADQPGSEGRWADAIEETLARLDGFWDGSRGFYRAHGPTEPGDARLDAEQELDISVILGVLHAGRASGPHSVLDPRAQSTLTALEELFEARYAINRGRPSERGPALGRYGPDRYYGGGAWYLATLAAAEFYFRLAQALGRGATLARVPENARFRQRLEAGEATTDPRELARRALVRGDSIMRTVRAFTPQSGELSEQFDPSSGLQTSAKHLSWSYAAFITAAAQRWQACRAIEGSDPGAPRAGTG
jgi:glucoamylase